jgi:hypothetical protein
VEIPGQFSVEINTPEAKAAQMRNLRGQPENPEFLRENLEVEFT